MIANERLQMSSSRTNDLLRRLTSSGIQTSNLPTLSGHHHPSQHGQIPEASLITFDELKRGPLSHHHVDTIIYLRIMHVIPHLGSIITVSDPSGAQGEVWSLIAKPFGTSLLPDMIISIRDPYFGEDIRARLAICLHHPTDCRLVSRFSPACQLFPELALQLNGAEWLNDVNTMFIAGRYHDAIDLCTRALQQVDASSKVQRGSLLLKRGLCFSRIGAWLSASTDAKDATDLMPKNALALKLAMNSALKSGDIPSSLVYGRRLLQHSPGDSLYRQMFRGMQLSAEQSRGEYNFSALLSATGASSLETNTCTYTGSLEIRASELGGRGMFATKKIDVGELILCERAVAIADTDGEYVGGCNGVQGVMPGERTNGRVFALLQNLAIKALVNDSRADRLRNPEVKLVKEQVFELHCSILADASMDDKTVPFNTYRALSILKYNMHTTLPGSTSAHHDFSDAANKIPPSSSIPTAKDQRPGLWLNASMFNHSCLPNLTWSWIDDLFIARANRAIEADEELTIAYSPNTYSHQRRNNILRSHNGFECSCLLCAADKNISKVDNDARSTMQSMLREKLTTYEQRGLKRTALVEKSVKNLVQSYKYLPYDALPKVGLADTFCQLANVYLGGDIDKWQFATAEMRNRAKTCFTAVLRVGLKIELVFDEKTGYCEAFFVLHSQPKAVGVVALMGLAELAFVDEKVAMCRAFKACAKQVYEIVYGESETFVEKHVSYKCYKEPAQRSDKPPQKEWQEVVRRAQLSEEKVPAWLL